MPRSFVLFVLASSLFLPACSGSSSAGSTAPVFGSVGGKPFAGATAFAFISASNADGQIDRQTIIISEGAGSCVDSTDLSRLAVGQRRLVVVAHGAAGTESQVALDAGKRSSAWLAVGTDKYPTESFFEHGSVVLERAATHSSFGEKTTDPATSGRIKLHVANAGVPDDALDGEIDFTLCW